MNVKNLGPSKMEFDEAAKGTVLKGIKVVKRDSPRPPSLVPSKMFSVDKYTDFDIVFEYGPPDEQKSKPSTKAK